MTSPVSPLATVREALESLREERKARSPLAPTGDVDEALVVLDSLDGTITLSREEEETLRSAASPLGRLRLSHSAACPLMHGGSCSCGVENIKALALLAARIEEAGK